MFTHCLYWYFNYRWSPLINNHIYMSVKCSQRYDIAIGWKMVWYFLWIFKLLPWFLVSLVVRVSECLCMNINGWLLYLGFYGNTISVNLVIQCPSICSGIANKTHTTNIIRIKNPWTKDKGQKEDGYEPDFRRGGEIRCPERDRIVKSGFISIFNFNQNCSTWSINWELVFN